MKLEVAKLSKRIIATLFCTLGAAVFIGTIYTYDFEVANSSKTTTTAEIGTGLLSYEAGGFILPFEVISVLLLAAMIGAIIIAKGKKLEPNKDELT